MVFTPREKELLLSVLQNANTPNLVIASEVINLFNKIRAYEPKKKGDTDANIGVSDRQE
jgi:hypothetical protein